MKKKNSVFKNEKKAYYERQRRAERYRLQHRTLPEDPQKHQGAQKQAETPKSDGRGGFGIPWH